MQPKTDIRQAGSFTPEQAQLKQLFQSKKLYQFVAEVEGLRKQNRPLSSYANELANFYSDVFRKNDRALQILNSSKTDWKVKTIDDKSELAVRVKGTNIELRYEGHLEADIQNLCIIIYQINLFDRWIPFCTKGQDLKQVSPLEKICYLQFNIPFVSNRYLYLYGLGIDSIDRNGTIIIYAEGISENSEMLKRFNIVPDKAKTDEMVVMDIKFFICEISHKSGKEFVFRSYCEVDSHMSFLPEWLLNAVIKQMGGFIFDRIIQHSHHFKGSDFEKEMNKDINNPFYPWIKNRVASWLGQKNGTQTGTFKI